MCLAIPGRIIEFDPNEPHLAKVDVAGLRRTVNVSLLAEDGIGRGDWVLIHVGFAMSKISQEAAGEQLRMLESLGEAQQALEEVRGYGFVEPRSDRGEGR